MADKQNNPGGQGQEQGQTRANQPGGPEWQGRTERREETPQAGMEGGKGGKTQQDEQTRSSDLAGGKSTSEDRQTTTGGQQGGQGQKGTQNQPGGQGGNNPRQ